MPKHHLRKTNQHCLNDCSRKLEGETNSVAGQRPLSGETSSILCLCSRRPTGGRANERPPPHCQGESSDAKQTGKLMSVPSKYLMRHPMSFLLSHTKLASYSWQPTEQWQCHDSYSRDREREWEKVSGFIREYLSISGQKEPGQGCSLQLGPRRTEQAGRKGLTDTEGLTGAN